MDYFAVLFPFLSTQRYFSSSRDSLAAAYVNRAAAVSSTASELDLSRKTRRRDLRGRLKLPATVTLASSGCSNEPPLIGHWGHRGASGGGPGGTGKRVSFITSSNCLDARYCCGIAIQQHETGKFFLKGFNARTLECIIIQALGKMMRAVLRHFSLATTTPTLGIPTRMSVLTLTHR